MKLSQWRVKRGSGAEIEGCQGGCILNHFVEDKWPYYFPQRRKKSWCPINPWILDLLLVFLFLNRRHVGLKKKSFHSVSAPVHWLRTEAVHCTQDGWISISPSLPLPAWLCSPLSLPVLRVLALPMESSFENNIINKNFFLSFKCDIFKGLHSLIYFLSRRTPSQIWVLIWTESALWNLEFLIKSDSQGD